MRLLIVLPSWLGDCVMATPTLRRIREAHRGAFIGALARPGMDQLFAGSDLFDEIHVERASGVMGPKFVAAKVRPRRYDVAFLLTNSFSTALTTRIAGIPRRIGYDRDGRGLLLTDRIKPKKITDGPRKGDWAIVPAVDYYWTASTFLLERLPPANGVELSAAPGYMELATTPQEEHEADDMLQRGGLAPDEPFAILNPGGNNPAKRWPADRFAALAHTLDEQHGLRIVINGSPAESALVDEIAAAGPSGCIKLPELGVRIGSLKALTARARIMITNDTGPRHLAAAFGVPVVTLFGPTDHRWTTIPTRPTGPERVILADPTLPETDSANDHPERCRIERITLETVADAAADLLAASGPRASRGAAGADVGS